MGQRTTARRFAGSFVSPEPWEDAVARLGPERIVFGTDAIAHDPVWELGRLLSLNVPDEQLKPILGGNLRAILARRKCE